MSLLRQRRNDALVDVDKALEKTAQLTRRVHGQHRHRRRLTARYARCVAAHDAGGLQVRPHPSHNQSDL